MYKTRTLIVALTAFAALGSQGCVGRAIGEGAEKTLGPKGAYWEIKPVASSKETKALSSYKNFELGAFKNEAGKNAPSEFLSRFPGELSKRLQKSRLPKDKSGKTLVFNVTIMHYETADASDNVFGPLEQVMARVELVDKASGDVLANGTAIGRTGKSVGLGTEWKAWGLSRALIKWASDYYPKGKDDKEEEE